jgi:hypothetical protein
VPWLDFPATPGVWVAVLVELTGVPATAGVSGAAVAFDDGDPDLAVRVTWPDGVLTKLHMELEP